jgi:RNA polymerase sigma-70 factor (family 1)
MNSIHSFTDIELSALLKDGNDAAFTEIYNRYWDKLYYIAHKLLRDTDAAEEIVQEVFLTLWKRRETLNIKSLSQYLGAMTRYAVYRHLAKEKQYKEEENKQGILNANAHVEIDLDSKIMLELVADIASKLPEKCRLVFQYNKLQDRSIIDVAEALNISQKTAEGHLTKALRIIRANLGSAVNNFVVFMVISLFLKK